MNLKTIKESINDVGVHVLGGAAQGLCTIGLKASAISAVVVVLLTLADAASCSTIPMDMLDVAVPATLISIPVGAVIGAVKGLVERNRGISRTQTNKIEYNH